MKTVDVFLNDIKHRMFLNDKGDCIAYSIQMSVRGKKTFWRCVWSAERHGYTNGDVPQRVKDLFNVRGVLESVAQEMGW